MTLEEIFTKAKEMQKEIMDDQAEVDKKKAEYKLFTKANFGLSDGETINVLDIAMAVVKIAKHD